MSIKEKINNPKIWQFITTILTAVIGYFGYEQVTQNSSPDIDIIVPDKEQVIQEHDHKHSHQEFKLLEDKIKSNTNLINKWH